MIVRFFYTILLSLLAPFLLFGLFRNKPGKPSVGKRWKEHFGITPPLTSSKKPIWIHAVSVGETLAVTPFVQALHQRYPHVPIIITTTTPTGAEQATKLNDIAEHRYMPLDYSFAVKRFIRIIRPSQILIMETELWPNTLHTLAKANIPITIINARLSEKACRLYQKVLPLFKQIEPCLTHILCQTKQDASHFSMLGVPQDKLTVTGSIKFDIHVAKKIIKQGHALRTYLGKQRPIWIAASTHQGEDEIILAAHKAITKTIPNALLILVPRHPERFNAVSELSSQIFHCVRRTQQTGNELAAQTSVYLADTMGEMLLLMQAADICFMGGSLLGDKVGGHNVLEPAAIGMPILIGPSYFNFKDIVENLEQRNGIHILNGDENISDVLITYFTNEEQRHKMAVRAQQFVEDNVGAIEKTIQYIQVAE